MDVVLVEEATKEVNNVRIPTSIESAQLKENGLSLRFCDIARIDYLKRYLLASTQMPMLLDGTAGALSEPSNIFELLWLL
jgi:hypothetical protein|eukprot:CAMPEP_0169398348 /NCGR_PEP_ID=MMETSP1017-20121227/52580_1 /TAXON_ID=342587 /ORGANISM="Karlodinium micrum, Strain CCMP2283" /LENGTH=79 /DNA_ID=CAMNT_0009503301 /DNA_START=530 /DNA_END=769 /DNA_ORIENTATION=+